MLSPLAYDHVQRPRYRGPLESANRHVYEGIPGGGPYVELWLIVEDDVIRQAAFQTTVCTSAIASTSVMCQLITGRDVAKAKLLTGQDLLLVLGGLPEGKESHAFRAIKALEAALSTEG